MEMEILGKWNGCLYYSSLRPYVQDESLVLEIHRIGEDCKVEALLLDHQELVLMGNMNWERGELELIGERWDSGHRAWLPVKLQMVLDPEGTMRGFYAQYRNEKDPNLRDEKVGYIAEVEFRQGSRK